jgi:hypothetical protein
VRKAKRKAKPRANAKPKASPRNGLALGAHNPEVRSASLLARAPARAPARAAARATARATARARKPHPLRRAARPPLASAQDHNKRGEQR